MHIFADAPADAAFVQRVAAARAFVTPTLSVTESTTGVAQRRLAPQGCAPRAVHHGAERTSLEGRFPEPTRIEAEPGASRSPPRSGCSTPAFRSCRHRRAEPGNVARVEPAPRARAARPGGACRPVAALRAATSVPGAHLQPARPGPHRSRTSRRPRPRRPATRAATSPPPATSCRSGSAAFVSSGEGGRGNGRRRRCGDHDRARQRLRCGDDIRAEFGSGWQTIDRQPDGRQVDRHAGRRSRVARTRRAARWKSPARSPQARLTRGPARCSSPATTPMAPADLSKFKEIVFSARGDGGAHQVMVFAARLGNIPATQPFTPGPEWREFVAAARLLLEPRRLGPARRAILRRVEARAVPVHDRRGAVPVSLSTSASTRPIDSQHFSEQITMATMKTRQGFIVCFVSSCASSGAVGSCLSVSASGALSITHAHQAPPRIVAARLDAVRLARLPVVLRRLRGLHQLAARLADRRAGARGVPRALLPRLLAARTPPPRGHLRHRRDRSRRRAAQSRRELLLHLRRRVRRRRRPAGGRRSLAARHHRDRRRRDAICSRSRRRSGFPRSSSRSSSAARTFTSARCGARIARSSRRTRSPSTWPRSPSASGSRATCTTCSATRSRSSS